MARFQSLDIGCLFQGCGVVNQSLRICAMYRVFKDKLQLALLRSGSKGTEKLTCLLRFVIWPISDC
jgi:hypothetical protein